MRKQLLQWGLAVLMMVLAIPSMAQGDVVAQWNFKTDTPSGIQAATNYERKEADVPSDVESITMHVNALNGKLNSVGHNYAQFNAGTVLQIPVKSTKDTVLVESYPGQHKFTVGGDAATADITKYVARSTDVAKGYVEVVGTGGSYLYRLQVTQVSQIQEKPLYSTTFTEWTDAKSSATESQVTVNTKYSKEQLTFNIFKTLISSTNQNTAKFPNWTGGYLMCDKAADPYIVTSPLASITRVHYIHGATGNDRGWRLECKGDGDADWVVLNDVKTGKPVDVNVDVNRKNCQLRFTNLNSGQNAYLFQLDIYGNVDMSKTPMLGAFKLNGTSYEAADIFAEDANGDQVGSIEISKKATGISESNPLTDITADNGEVTSTTYAQKSDTTVVTMVVTSGADKMNYILNVVRKPDYTVSYLDTEGKVISTMTYEKDEVYGSKEMEDLSSKLTIPAGSALKGWALDASTGQEIQSETVITSNLNLKPVILPIETANDTARYDYDLTNQFFYAKNHEGFVPEGMGKFHDGTHGWSFGNGDKVKLLVGGKGYIKLGLCQYGSGVISLTDTKGEVLATVAGKGVSDGSVAILNYDNISDGAVWLNFNATAYLHNVAIVNMSSLPYTKNGNWYEVKAGDAGGLLTAIEQVNGANSAVDAPRSYIYLPNGTYDLGDKALTTLSGNNVSIVGESMDKTIIVNKPRQEGIGVTATLLNLGKNNYLGNLTLKNAYAYGTTADGRAVCLQDKGDYTICQRVRMLSYQDTYYSNNDSGRFYWVDSDLHGVVDFLCGGGNVFYNRCTLTIEPSKQCYITAPNGSASNYGYVFDSCRIVSPAATKIYLGRSWGGAARCAFLNTTFDAQSAANIAATRWMTEGMNVIAKNFWEYNSLDENGNVISPAENTVTFTLKGATNTYNTIMTAEQAANFTLEKVFGDWKPADKTVELPAVSNLKLDAGNLSWDAVSGAVAYAVYKDGSLLAITEQTAYAIEGTTRAEAAAPAYSVRAINSLGTIGKEASVATGIRSTDASAAKVLRTEVYDAAGARRSEVKNGFSVERSIKSDGSVEVRKVMR